MASQWVIRRNGEGLDVLWRERPTASERRSHLEALEADGMSSWQAEMELRAMEGGFTRCNESQTFTREACFEFILGYAKPGDVLIEGGVAWICMEPAKA
jgi:hypothetical protein